MAETLHFHSRGPRFQLLVRELRSYKPHNIVKKLKLKKNSFNVHGFTGLV